MFSLSIDFHDFLNAFRCSQAWVVNNMQSCIHEGSNKVRLLFRPKIFAIGPSYHDAGIKHIRT